MNANELLTLGLTNAAFATVLAACGWLLTRVWQNPHVAAVVWLVVLLKLVTPPLVSLPIPLTTPTMVEKVSIVEPPTEKATPAVIADLPGRIASEDNFVEQDEAFEAAVTPSAMFANESDAAEESGTDVMMSAGNGIASSSGPEASREAEAASMEPLPAVVVTTEPQESLESATDSLVEHLPRTLVAFWMLGTLAMIAVTLFRITRFKRCLRLASLANAEVHQEASAVAQRLGLRRCPKVSLIEANVGPLVWAGGLQPLVVVPRSLWETLEPAARETLLAHELAHIIRRDHWVRRFETLVLAAFWWLPTAWLAVRQREAAAETCCDALVLNAYPDRPRDYAEALFHAVSVMSAARPIALASGLGRISELKERLAMIAHDKVPKRPNRSLRMLFAVLGVGVLLLSARFVQADPEEKKPQSNLPVFGVAASNGGLEGLSAEVSVPVFETGATDPAATDSEVALVDMLSDEGPYRGSFGPAMAQGGMSPLGMVPPGGMQRPGGSRGGSSRRSATVRPPDEAVAKMLAGLKSVIESPNEPAEVKLQAMRSYGRLARGTSDAKAAEEVLLAAANAAKDERVTLAAADALHRLGSPKGTELMWSLFEKSEDPNTRVTSIRVLDAAGAVPPSVESVRKLVTYATGHPYGEGMMGGGDMGSMMGMGGGMPMNDALGILQRLTQFGDGIRRLVEATESFPADDAAGMAAEDGRAAYGGGVGMAMGVVTPRTTLLGILRDTNPADEELSAALVEALSSKDAGVRAAAAQALGNVSERTQAAPSEPASESRSEPSREELERLHPEPRGDAQRQPSAPRGYDPNATATPMATPALSDVVRGELIKSLTSAAQDDKATPASRIAALRSLAKVVQGTSTSGDVLAIAKSTAENAEDADEKQSAAEVVLELTPKEERLSAIWQALPSASLAKQVDYVTALNDANAIPPDALTTIAVARVTLICSASGMSSQAPSYSATLELLDRMCTSAEGIERLSEAIRMASSKEYEKLSLPKDFSSLVDFNSLHRDYMLRQVLVGRLHGVRPTSDEVVRALSKLLMSDDDHVRKAAATALGNVGNASSKKAENDRVERSAKRYFELLDADKDGSASVEELLRLQRLRPAFEAAGIKLDEEMSETQFLEAYLKAQQE